MHSGFGPENPFLAISEYILLQIWKYICMKIFLAASFAIDYKILQPKCPYVHTLENGWIIVIYSHHGVLHHCKKKKQNWRSLWTRYLSEF